MKNFIQRLFGFSMGPVLGALISLVQVPVLTYFLSSGEYGQAGAFQTLLLQIPNFIYIGIDQAYTREYNHRKDKQGLFQQALVIPMTVGLAIVLVFTLFDQQISTWLFDSPDYDYIIWYAGVWVIFTVVERFILLSIRMEERAIEYSMYTLLLKVGVFALSMFLILIGMRDFRVIVFGLVFGHIIVDAFLVFKYRKLLDFSGFKIDIPLIRGMFRFGFPLMIASALSGALNAVDTIFLNHFSSDEQLGVYTLGLRIAGIVGVIKTAFSSFWVPTSYRWYEENKSMKHYKYISDALLLLLTVLFFGILLFKKPVGWIVSLQDETYGNVQYIFGMLIFPHMMYALSETTTLGIVFSRKTHYNIYVSLFTFIPSVLINFVLTPTFGFRGAAIASTIAYICFYLARTYFSSLTGFYFSQKVQITSIIIMTAAGIMNMFEIPYIEIYTIILGIITLVIQIPTIKTTLEIKNNSADWDFS